LLVQRRSPKRAGQCIMFSTLEASDSLNEPHIDGVENKLLTHNPSFFSEEAREPI